MKNIGMLAVLALLVSCNAEKITTVKVVHSLDSDALSGEIKVNSQKLNFNGSSGETFEIKGTYPRNLSMDLDYTHAEAFYANSVNKLPATEINMKFEVRGYNSEKGTVDLRREGSVKLQGEKFKLTNCSNTVDFKVDGSELTIDMSKFKSLASCKFVGKYKNHNRIGEKGRLHNGFGRNFFKFDSDKDMGLEASYAIRSQFSGYVYKDGEMAEYLQKMLTKIAKASDMPDLEPKVYFINAPIENAFALPGGYVFVFRGLIEALETEAELAGVLGHEWAHVTERHGTESVSRNLKNIATKYVGAGLVWAQFNIFGAAAAYYIYDKLEEIPLMGFSRLQELEADKIGVQYAHEAGYSPYGLSKFFAAMGDRQESWLELLVSTHPRPSTRVEKIEELVFNYIPYSRDAVVTSEDYLAAKETMNEIEPMPYYIAMRVMAQMGGLVEESIKSSVRKKFKLEKED
ncbi:MULTISPECIES: M48 family metallopeptidase [Halobacteriovorax]|uniref:Peptidase M48 domain-containing protein n=3 Tax=Halobacteriovorax TaxID=1652133 RepID=A0ABY0II07_9BACT|nr:M48 family metallopeptidase [Halobacteriovorax vibrionivorans]RZF22589.1 hypothetical protein DAY19_02115 [Halobacteriovorax vibrionivorans]